MKYVEYLSFFLKIVLLSIISLFSIALIAPYLTIGGALRHCDFYTNSTKLASGIINPFFYFLILLLLIAMVIGLLQNTLNQKVNADNIIVFLIYIGVSGLSYFIITKFILKGLIIVLFFLSMAILSLALHNLKEKYDKSSYYGLGIIIIMIFLPCKFLLCLWDFTLISLLLVIESLVLFFIVRTNLLYYPFHLYEMYIGGTFEENPFNNNIGIYFNILGAKQKFLFLSKYQPEEALTFSNNLFLNHPSQNRIGAEIQHVAVGTILAQNPFNADKIIIPNIPSELTDFLPSEEWILTLKRIKENLIQYQIETNKYAQRDNFLKFGNSLLEFRRLNLLQSEYWRDYYKDALHNWLIESNNRFEILKRETTNIIHNPYHVGDPLSPSKNTNVFLGREDLRESMRASIENTTQIPIILLQGQRRVGKTSVLNFLPSLLGERIKVIYFDLSSTENSLDFKTWILSIFKKTNLILDIEADFNGKNEEDWLVLWDILRLHLTEVLKDKSFKIILAFDEYEALHAIFREKPSKGTRVLAAIKSFINSQEKIIFLFSGSALFFELENPTWSDHFVGVLHQRIGYLSKEDTDKLIRCPYPDFPITYDFKTIEYIYDVTQGHPALVQFICYELVQFANQNNDAKIKFNDAKKIVTEKIIVESNAVLNVFWKQFCSDAKMKNNVIRIVKGEKNIDQSCLKKLLRHEFVIGSKEKGYKMKVPIFIQWIRKYEMN